MTELFAILGALAALGIALAGILAAWRLLLTASVERARLRFERTPWRCFWLGCLAVAILLPSIATMFALPLVLTRIAGLFLLLTLMAFAGLGGASLAARIGQRLTPHSHGDSPPAGVFVRGSLLVEMATGLWLGGVATVILLPPAIILLGLPLKLAWPIVWATIVVLGLLGAARPISLRIGQSRRPAVASLPHGSAAPEPAGAGGFTGIGWFVFLPAAFLASLGAAIFALIRWMPQRTESREGLKPRAAVISFLVLLWLLPLIAVSVSTAVFLVRGGVALELAASFPFVGWLAVVLLWTVMAIGGTILAMSHWGRWWQQPLPSGGQE